MFTPEVISFIHASSFGPECARAVPKKIYTQKNLQREHETRVSP